jgi:hypothetical protein
MLLVYIKSNSLGNQFEISIFFIVVQTIRNKTDLNIIGQNINLVDTIVGNSSVEDGNF